METLYKQAKSYLDSLHWPAGFRYELSFDLLSFYVYKEDFMRIDSGETLMYTQGLIHQAMTHLRTMNPAVSLEAL